jgi:hypothetical protein
VVEFAPGVRTHPARLDTILRRPSAAACRPKSARRVRVGGERRVSLACGSTNRGNLTPTYTSSASEKRGWGEGGVRVCPRCRDAVATYTRHLLESTHTNTHKHKQTHNLARQSTVRTHAVAAPSSSEEGASPPPPANCISVAISHAEAMCTATDRRCACSASHVDVDQLTTAHFVLVLPFR